MKNMKVNVVSHPHRSAVSLYGMPPFWAGKIFKAECTKDTILLTQVITTDSKKNGCGTVQVKTLKSGKQYLMRFGMVKTLPITGVWDFNFNETDGIGSLVVELTPIRRLLSERAPSHQTLWQRFLKWLVS